MRVATDGDTVSVHYVGTFESGEQFDSSRERADPLSFVLGSGSVVPGFEAAVRGMAPGASKRAVLSPTEAYGERTDELVMAIPRDRAPQGIALDVGQKVPLTNGAMATVLGVTEDEIKLDANHELAGKTLVFDLELVEIKDGVLGKPAEGLERVVFGFVRFPTFEFFFSPCCKELYLTFFFFDPPSSATRLPPLVLFSSQSCTLRWRSRCGIRLGEGKVC